MESLDHSNNSSLITGENDEFPKANLQKSKIMLNLKNNLLQQVMKQSAEIQNSALKMKEVKSQDNKDYIKGTKNQLNLSKIKQDINVQEFELRDTHSEWESEISDSDMCTDVGLAVEIHDDEEMLSKYEDEVEEEIESRKEKKGWSGIKNILAVQKASK